MAYCVFLKFSCEALYIVNKVAPHLILVCIFKSTDA